MIMEPRHLEMVHRILSKYPYTFYAFGSRARGNPWKFSDLDLLVKEPLPWQVRSQLEEDFEESDLPFEVDVVEWNRCDDTFRQRISKDLELVQEGKEEESSLSLLL